MFRTSLLRRAGSRSALVVGSGMSLFKYGLVAAAVALLAFQASVAQAVSYYWDTVASNGQIDGGGGAWDIATGNWTQDGGASNLPWANGATNDAYIGYETAPSPGVLTLGASITAGALNFNITGYQITLGGNTLTLNAAGSGVATVDLNNASSKLTLQNNGNGTGAPESINFLENVAVSTNGTIVVDRINSAGANKTLQLGTLGIGANTLTVTNNNGYGLEFVGTTTLGGIATFSVSGGSNAPVVQGLKLSGQVTGAFTLIKSGPGTLVLSNGTNDFGIVGGGSGVSITGGLVSITSDAALGQAFNQVSLSGNGAGLQLDGTFNVAHRINTIAATGVIDVTQGNMATLITAFNGGAVTSTPFAKNGNGILEINVDNTANYTGAITVNAGAIRVSNAGALGSLGGITAVTNSVGAAVQINGVSIAETFTIANTGLNTGGAIENYSGTNTLSGLITLTGAATIGADSGTVLNITGGILAGTNALTFAGAGNITVNTNQISGTTAAQTKLNSGTLNIQNADPLTGTITVQAGILKLDAAGTTAGNVVVNPGAALTLDNSGTSTPSRLGGKTLTLAGGTFNYTANAAGTAETTGAWTLSPGYSAINVTPGATGALITAASLAYNVGSQLYIADTGIGSATNYIKVTAAPTQNGGGGAANSQNISILPYVVINDGTNPIGFATNTGTANNDGTKGLRALTSGEYASSIPAPIVSQSRNVALTATQTMYTPGYINSLKLDSGGGVAGSQLVMGSGGNGSYTGIIANTGNNGISSTLLSINTSGGGNNQGYVVFAFDDLTISSLISSGYSLTKAGTGNLTLSNANLYSGQTTINGGTITLSGGNNRLLINQAMVVNKGGTLDLGANNQQVGTLSSTGSVVGAGGIITGSGTLTVNEGTASTFAGRIRGSVKLVKSGSQLLTLTDDSDTSGSISVLANGLTLKDGGKLSGTTQINVKFTTLTIDNTGTMDLQDGRVNNAAAITLDGGTLTFLGRPQMNSIETLGAVTANSGTSTITATPGGTGVNSAALTLTSLTRNPGAVVNFTGTNLGQLGNNSRIFISTGQADGLIGPWAIVGGVDLAAYNSGTGVGAVGTAGFPLYSTAASLAVAAPTDNYKASSSQAVANGGQTVNSLVIAGNYNITFPNTTDVLTLTSGALIKSGNNANSIGAAADSGVLTTTGSELILWNNQNTLTVNSAVQGSGVKAIFAGGGTIALTSNNNNYTGGTLVDSGTVSLSNALGSVVIPAGGLTLNNATVTMVTNGGQIDASNVVTLNGGSTLTLAGSNTLAGITFNSFGGGGTPTLSIPGANTQTITGSIISSSNNVAVTPIISGAAGAVIYADTLKLSSTTGGAALSVGANVTLNATTFDVSGGNAWINNGGTLLSIDHLDFASLARDIKFTGTAPAISNAASNVVGGASVTFAGPTATLYDSGNPGGAGNYGWTILGGADPSPANNATIVLGGTSATLGTFSASTLSLKSETSVTLQQNVTTGFGSGTDNLTVGQVSAATNQIITIGGTTTVALGSTLKINTNNGYRVNLGAVTNNGTLYSAAASSPGVYITGAYTGNGADVVLARGGGFSGGIQDGSAQANEAGIHFANAMTSTVGTLALSESSSVRTGQVYVEGGSTVVITNRLSHAPDNGTQNGSSFPSLVLRGGSSVIMDTNATVFNSGTNTTTNFQRFHIGGDGNAANVFEVRNTAVDFGQINNPNNQTSSYIDIGGLNFIQHAANAGTNFSVGIAGGTPGYLNFNGLDNGGGLSAGWTIKGAGAATDGVLNVITANSGAVTALLFNNSRFVDVQGTGQLNVATNVTTNIAAGKTVTKKGTGTMTFNGQVTGGGILAVDQGTVKINNGFSPNLTIGTGATTAAVVGGATTGAIGTLGSLEVGSNGTLTLSSSPLTAWGVGGDITLRNGATLNYALGANTDSLATPTGNFVVSNSDTYNIVFSGDFTGTQWFYPLISAASQANFGATWKATNLPANTSLATAGEFGNGVFLVYDNAAPVEWARTGGGTSSGNWNDPLSWTGTVPNVASAIALLGTNASDTPTTVTLNAPIMVGTIYMYNDTASYAVDTTSNALTIDAGAGTGLVWAITGNHSISGTQGIVLATNSDFKASPGASLSVANISGIGKNVTATGTIAISGSNAYTGTTTVLSGATTLTGSLASPTLTVNNGATLNLNTGSSLSAPDVTDNGTINVNANSSFGTLAGDAAKTVTVASGLTLSLGRDGAPVSTVGPAISGGNLVKNGDSILRINNNANGVFDSVTINAGMLVDTFPTATVNPGRVDAVRSTTGILVNSSGTFGLWAGDGVAHYDYDISGTGGKVRVLAGSTAIDLRGNNSYTGGTELESGTTVTGNWNGVTGVGEAGGLHGTITGLGATRGSAGIGITTDTPITYDGLLLGALNVTFSAAAPAVAPNVTLASSGNTMTGTLAGGTGVTIVVPDGALTNLEGATPMVGFSVGAGGRLILNESTSWTFGRTVGSGGAGSVFETHGSGAMDASTATIATNAISVTGGSLTGVINTSGSGPGFTSANQGNSTLAINVDTTLTLNQTGSQNLQGAITGGSSGLINYNQDAGSTVTISGNASAYQGDLSVNQGTVRVNTTGSLNVKTYTGASTTLTADGPTTITNAIAVTNVNASSTLIVGGAVTAANNISLTGAGVLQANGAVTATAGSITTAGTSSLASGIGTGVTAGTTISVNGASLLTSYADVTAGTNITVAGTLNALTAVAATAGSITTSGTGALYSGSGFGVSAGTSISVNGTSMLNSSAGVTAGSGAISVAGIVTALGNVAAGTSVTLTSTGTLNALTNTLTAPTGVSATGTINSIIAGNTAANSVILNSTVSGSHTLGDITLSGTNKGITVGLNNTLNAGAINGGLVSGDSDANVNVTGQLYAASFTAVNSVNVTAGGILIASNAAATNQAQALNVVGTANIAGALTVAQNIFVGTGATAGSLTAGATSANVLALTGGAPSTAELASYTTTGTSPSIDVGASTTLTVSGGVVNNGTFTVDGIASVGALSGSTGITVINNSLTADSIIQDTLTIGAGGTVTIRPTTAGADLGGASNLSQVPEPGTWVLLAAGAVCLLPLVRRLRRRAA